MQPPPKRLSFKDGDPFAERPIAARDDEDPELVLWGLRRQLRWQIYGSVLAGLVGLALVVLLVQNRDHFAYVLRPAAPPLALGSVTDVTPEQIPDNSFVSIEGITEHRGLVKPRARGLSLRRDYWYFRLLGGRGIFLETPADKERFGTVTEVHVRGRAVDPTREGGYDDVLATYRDKYRPQERPVLRIIQVDAYPGTGRLPYLLLSASALSTLLLAGLGAQRARTTSRRLRGNDTETP